MAKNYRHNIKSVLNAVNQSNYDYFDSWDEEDIKALSPYVLTMWMKGAKTNKEVHTVLTNMYVNPYIYKFSNKPDLLYKLIVYANGGNNSYFEFKKASSQSYKDKENIKRYFKINDSLADGALKIVSDDLIKQLREVYDEMDQ